MMSDRKKRQTINPRNRPWNGTVRWTLAAALTLICALSGCRQQRQYQWSTGEPVEIQDQYLPSAPGVRTQWGLPEEDDTEMLAGGWNAEETLDAQPGGDGATLTAVPDDPRNADASVDTPYPILRAPQRTAKRQTPSLSPVYFDFNSASITEEMKPALQRAADFFKKYPNLQVQIQGYADSRGTLEYNYHLGQQRAHAAREFLIGRGVNPAQIYTISYGEENPASLEENEEGWALNRRVEFFIY
ncbi:OmpA family protein [Candidatus Sumerlaeota bacterium]|nr:OmpA family protein [Candidatus Sumerlaeota bacterium]